MSDFITKEALGVLRKFGKTGYRPAEVILGALCPHLRSGTTEYANALSQIERGLDTAVELGLAERDDLDFPEAQVPCYQIV